MTTTTNNFEGLESQLKDKGTPYVVLEPCDKCGCPIYYYRKGRRHNGCVGCFMSAKSANAKQVVLTSIQEVDENGTPIYIGRACKECGNKIRLGERAYGAKNIGACRACAIHQQQQREHGKEIKRVNTVVSRATHKFIVASMERSGVVEVAPLDLGEYMAVKDLILRKTLMNQQEESLNTGIRWEIGHKFPANGGGTEYRGKATVENLYLVQMEVNRRDGDDLPEEWTTRQVISIADCQLIMNSHEAAQAWKARKPTNATPEQLKEWTIKDRQLQEEHKQRVREITQGMNDSLPILELGERFYDELDNVRNQWNKVVLKMNRAIDAAHQSGRKIPYAEVREERLTIDAFCGAEARMSVVVQTLEQIADAEMILREQGLTSEQEGQLFTLKRAAVMWCRDVLDYPRDLVMGFTHPLLSVLGNPMVWGTKLDETTGQQWLCCWVSGQELREQATPFDGEPDWTNANPKLQVPTSEPVREWGSDEAKGWKSTDVDYLYEREEQKRKRAAREKADAEKRAALEARQAVVKEQTSKRLARLIGTLRDGLEGLYGYAGAMLPDCLQAEANQIIMDIYAEASEQEAELTAIGERDYTTVEAFEGALNSWLGANDYRMRQMRKGAVVFADLLNPF
ncbi:hypothetical protein ACSDH9_004097 [Cronobacter sakazakii]